MKIIQVVDVSEERDPQGKLTGPSWPIGIHFYRNEAQRVDTYCVDTLQKAEMQAQEWATLKRGHMAVVYQRASGTVRAQYAQFRNGFLAHVRYDARQAILEQHNLHWFDEGDPADREDGRDYPPLSPGIQPHTVPLQDGERDEVELFAFLHAPVPSKISIDIVADRPLEEPTEDEILLTVQIDLTDGTLSVLCWNRQRNGQDPHKFIAATLPPIAVTQRLSHYEKLREQGHRVFARDMSPLGEAQNDQPRSI